MEIYFYNPAFVAASHKTGYMVYLDELWYVAKRMSEIRKAIYTVIILNSTTLTPNHY